MTDRDDAVRAAMSDVAHAAPSPPPLERLAIHQPRRHPTPRWATVAAAVVVAGAVAAVTVAVTGRSDGATVTSPSTTEATSTTIETTTTTIPDIVVIDPLIAEWTERIAGQTITYTATYSCFCDGGGTWVITERDGEVLEATFIDDPQRADLPVPFTFSDALRFAATANGFARVTASGSASLTMQVDVEKDAIDDEYDYAVRDVTFVDPTPLEVTGGEFGGLGLSPLLPVAASEFGVEPVEELETPSIPGVWWTPCLTSTGPHWTLRSGGLLMVFEGSGIDDARMTNWVYAGGTAGGHLTMAIADDTGIGSTIDELLAANPDAGQFGDVVDSNGVRFGLTDGGVVWFGRVDCAAD